VDPFKPHRNVGGSFSASEWRRRGAEAMFETAMALKEEADWVDRRLYYD
jgi:hypothetical protein